MVQTVWEAGLSHRLSVTGTASASTRQEWHLTTPDPCARCASSTYLNTDPEHLKQAPTRALDYTPWVISSGLQKWQRVSNTQQPGDSACWPEWWKWHRSTHSFIAPFLAEMEEAIPGRMGIDQDRQLNSFKQKAFCLPRFVPKMLLQIPPACLSLNRRKTLIRCHPLWRKVFSPGRRFLAPSLTAGFLLLGHYSAAHRCSPLDQRLVHLQELTSSLIPCATWQPDVAGELNHAEQGQEQHRWNCHVTPAVLSLQAGRRRSTMHGMPRRRGGMVGHQSNRYLQGLMALIPLSTACIWKQHSILSALLPLLTAVVICTSKLSMGRSANPHVLW